MTIENGSFINDDVITQTLQKAARRDEKAVREVLGKALELKGLELDDIAVLAAVSDPDLLKELFTTARKVKETIYGRRLVLFAPLYISNLCSNECLYCAFRAKNTAVRRRALTQEEIRNEVEILIKQGHKRALVVAGESYPNDGFNYVLEAINTVYDTKIGSSEIRRVNVNIAPLTLDEFKLLKDAKIGTYQLFQETYHRQTYSKVHVGGLKKYYE